MADGKKFSLGVEPTVGLGAALLIFLGVGVFAAGIAQAFQLVSFIKFPCLFQNFDLMSCLPTLKCLTSMRIEDAAAAGKKSSITNKISHVSSSSVLSV